MAGMSRRFIAIAAATLIALAAGAGDARAQFIVKQYAVDYEVQADGRYVRIERRETQATNDAAAKDIGQQALPYSESLEELEIVEAYTLKRDGRRLAVNPAAIFSQLPQGSPQVAEFSDQRQKVIVFPDVAAGDSVGYVALKRVKPPLPGRFSISSVFPRTIAFNDAKVRVVAPKTLPLRVEAHEMVVEKSTKGDNVVYQWRHVLRSAVIEDLSPISVWDRAPRAFISSDKDYAELGRAYASQATPKARVTTKIEALAAQVTAGISDRREQARKLYEWVSREIRYVAIILGTGAMVPHDAEAVLANRYGDCKDHVVLFEALLKAKGIDSEMVLINLGNSYKLPDVPTFAQLNHVINWLPEFGLYVDTTLAVAPFGTLSFEEYGKPVVHAGGSGPALRKTPVTPLEAASSTTKTTMRLQADGRSTIDTEMSATGPLSLILREMALKLQVNGTQRMARAELRERQMEGTGDYRFTSPKELAPDYRITGHFDVEPLPHLLSGNGFTMSKGMSLLWPPGDLLMGPLGIERLRDTEPTPCYPGRIVEELSIELPPGRRIAKLPEDKDIHTANLAYSSHYAFDGRTLSMRREFTARVEDPLCSGEVRKASAAALSAIRADYRSQAALAVD
jgi:transglutaminase-like putative cysteine protease